MNYFIIKTYYLLLFFLFLEANQPQLFEPANYRFEYILFTELTNSTNYPFFSLLNDGKPS